MHYRPVLTKTISFYILQCVVSKHLLLPIRPGRHELDSGQKNNHRSIIRRRTRPKNFLKICSLTVCEWPIDLKVMSSSQVNDKSVNKCVV